MKLDFIILYLSINLQVQSFKECSVTFPSPLLQASIGQEPGRESSCVQAQWNPLISGIQLVQRGPVTPAVRPGPGSSCFLRSGPSGIGHLLPCERTLGKKLTARCLCTPFLHSSPSSFFWPPSPRQTYEAWRICIGKLTWFPLVLLLCPLHRTSTAGSAEK